LVLSTTRASRGLSPYDLQNLILEPKLS